MSNQSAAEALRQQILAYVGYGADDVKFADEIMAGVTAYAATVEREAIERIRVWTEYNKHDMGEMGKFIRTQYVYNKLDDELDRLTTLQGPQGKEQ